MKLDGFAPRAEAYCTKTRGSVTSWIRTARHNAEVGGKPESLHRFGLAIDVVYDDPVPLAFAQAVANGLGLQVIRESNHDHIQPLKR